jgi:hypothetical protein
MPSDGVTSLSTRLAVCWLTIAAASAKRRFVIGLYQISRLPFHGPNEVTAGSCQDAAQLTVEGRGHSRHGHHRYRLHAFRDDVHLDLVAARGKPILRRDFGSDFEDTGDELLKGGYRRKKTERLQSTRRGAGTLVSIPESPLPATVRNLEGCIRSVPVFPFAAIPRFERHSARFHLQHNLT